MSIGAAAQREPDHRDARRAGRVAVVRGASVSVHDEAVAIEGWRTRTPEVVRWFTDRADDGEDLDTSLELALKVGVVALSTVGVSVNVDYVEKEFARFSNQLESSLERRLTQLESAFEEVFADGDGRLARALGTYLGEGGHLAELFHPERRDSAIGRVRELLGEHFDGESSKLARLLDLSNPNGPLASWKHEIEAGFHGLRRQLDDYRKELSEQAAAREAAVVARADEAEKGTQKGRVYEEEVSAALTSLARSFGDTVEPAGDTVGVGTSKKGDFVITLNRRDTRGAEIRIAVEAKDSRVGLTDMLRQLDGAKRNRGAVAAIAVYSREDAMPSDTAPFCEQTESRYLALLDKDAPEDRLALQLAYRAARFWALAENAPQDAEVDATAIRDDVEAARQLLQGVASVKSKLTRMRNGVDEAATAIGSSLETLRSDLVAVLDRIDARIRLDADRPSAFS